MKRAKYFFIAIIFLFVSKVATTDVLAENSPEIKFKIEALQKEPSILVGDPVYVRLMFWPKTEEVFKKLEKANKGFFGESIYIFDLGKIEISKKNIDLLTVNAGLVFLNAKISEHLTYAHDGLNFVLKNEGLKILEGTTKSDEKQQKAFIILDQTKYTDSNYWPYLFLFFLAMIFFLNWLKRLLQKKKNKGIEREKRLVWKGVFSNIDSKNTLNKIYCGREEIFLLFNVNNKDKKALCEILNKYQYMPQMTEEELNSVANFINTKISKGEI